MANRLAQETSPYLLQHKDNPVDWYPWGDEAFAKAKAEDKPVFLSIGYSSCHWCHVMEHESFEDEEVAKVLNDRFVCVKVDREERPDVDEAYMTAVQMYAGRGGWPMSLFLTADRKPFFAGTYFPKVDRGQYPGFMTVLAQIGSAWAMKKEDMIRVADEFSGELSKVLVRDVPPPTGKLDDAFIDQAVAGLVADFDPENAGFGAAPKFPPHAAIEMLLAYGLRPNAPQEHREAALGVSISTLEHMALGGIHDHVGGGFHRYSTDATWLLPHFEKMLYDNALMMGNYARAAAICHELEPRLEQLFTRTAHGILDWLSREMTAPEGYFYSALDADSEGEEGKFYVWSTDEVRDVLGPRAAAFIETYQLREEGNFHDEATQQLTGGNIPHLMEDDEGKFAADLATLRTAREKRVRPGLDDKALVGWNGLMIGALAEAGALDLAERAAIAILKAETAYGKLPHQIAKGKPSGDAFLDDYAGLADGFLRIAAYREFLEANREYLQSQGFDVSSPWDSARWRGEAARLCKEMVARFYDEDNGGFFQTSPEHEVLFGRTKPAFDQPVPSGNALAIRSLVDLGDVKRVIQSLNYFLGWMQKIPQATESLLLAAFPVIGAQPEPKVEVLMTNSTEPVAESSAPVVIADVQVRLEGKELKAAADGKATGAVVIEIPDGFHLNTSTPPARWLIPTKLEFQPVKAAVQYPEGEGDQYRGTLRIPFEIQIPTGESGVEFEVTVSYQACTDQACQEPKQKRFSAVALR